MGAQGDVNLLLHETICLFGEHLYFVDYSLFLFLPCLIKQSLVVESGLLFIDYKWLTCLILF